jgi:hypothetical protein
LLCFSIEAPTRPVNPTTRPVKQSPQQPAANLLCQHGDSKVNAKFRIQLLGDTKNNKQDKLAMHDVKWSEMNQIRHRFSKKMSLPSFVSRDLSSRGILTLSLPDKQKKAGLLINQLFLICTINMLLMPGC